MNKGESCVLTFEFGQRKAICRSCNKSIEPKTQIRAQLVYPHIVVKYKTKEGCPCFFLHFDCCCNQPVDFVKGSGNRSWKYCRRMKEGQRYTTMYKVNVALDNVDEKCYESFVEEHLKRFLKKWVQWRKPLLHFDNRGEMDEKAENSYHLTVEDEED
jgi:hypothetical protein